MPGYHGAGDQRDNSTTWGVQDDLEWDRKMGDGSRLQHWYTFIYKAILGEILPAYISSKFQVIKNGLNLRSNDWIRCVVPKFSSEVGKKCLAFNGPWVWNDLQQSLKLATLISVRRFKSLIVVRSHILVIALLSQVILHVG